jgi:uncharacterized OsmC-like protein
MLLQALVACAGVTLRSVATNRGIEVTGTVRADGDLDFRGTLGVDRNAPVGFASVRLNFDLDSTASKEELDELTTTTERYCVVYQILASHPSSRSVIHPVGAVRDRTMRRLVAARRPPIRKSGQPNMSRSG